jgi:hypothetical protein
MCPFSRRCPPPAMSWPVLPVQVHCKAAVDSSGDRYLDHARTIVAREPRMTHQPCVSSVATGSADARLAEPRASTG